MRWLRKSTGEDHFDPIGTFVPENIPEIGDHLEAHDVLDGDRHIAVHQCARDLYETFGVYDMTFGYNLADLNRDRRHPDAGCRYAESATENDVLLIAFTPTTEFCPAAEPLAVGMARAWNRSETAPYGLVRVRVSPMYHASETLNRRLRDMVVGESEFGSSVSDHDGESHRNQSGADPGVAPPDR